jgi:RNA polymerase-binding transcription factor DksA
MLGKTEIRARLTEQRTALMAQIGRIEGEFGRSLDDDYAEQAVEREDEEALDLLESSALTHLERIEKAIARLDAGTYGLCTLCGEAIAVERLTALPEATECIRCAEGPAGHRSILPA